VDVGIRVELPATTLEALTSVLYEPKLVYFTKGFDDKVRTFCVCPYGEVVSEWNGDVLTVNGHSYANRRTLNTNFALLVSKTFTEPFNNPIEYGKSIARLANLLGDGIIVQRLGDLEQGRRSTVERMHRSLIRPSLRSATPGDLGWCSPIAIWRTCSRCCRPWINWRQASIRATRFCMALRSSSIHRGST